VAIAGSNQSPVHFFALDASCAYPFESLHAQYRVMSDAFGPRRLFWGTDITKMPCSRKE